MVTMDQLLESLINKAKIESQDAHRLLLCALNGMTNVYCYWETPLKSILLVLFVSKSKDIKRDH